jgi:hypothetical protein
MNSMNSVSKEPKAKSTTSSVVQQQGQANQDCRYYIVVTETAATKTQLPEPKAAGVKANTQRLTDSGCLETKPLPKEDGTFYGREVPHPQALGRRG